MDTIFSTADVRPAERYDYWHSIVRTNLIEHDGAPEDRHTFEATVRAGCLVDIGLLEMAASPLSVEHSTRHFAHGSNDDLIFLRTVAGQMPIEQNGRNDVLKAGEMTLLDPRLPYKAAFINAPGKALALCIPRALLVARGFAPDMVGLTIRPEPGDTALISSFLGALPQNIAALSPGSEAVVREHALDLIAMSLGKVAGSPPDLSSAGRFAAMNLRAAIEAKLSDPNLDVEAAAAAAGMSVRHANEVLAHEETSLQRLIMDRRLARCRRALQDPSQRHRSVGEIAYGWGFNDLPHFSRSFKRAFGLAPTDYRNLHQLTFLGNDSAPPIQTRLSADLDK
jgi:AraC family transcriptional activator of tynA and feaB